MDKFKKRDATLEEEEKELINNSKIWDNYNPGFEISIEKWREKLAEAKKEGYKSEVCECGSTFLAFHHFTTCKREQCPFSDGVSLLDRMKELNEK